LKQLEYTDIRFSGFAANNYPACGICIFLAAAKSKFVFLLPQKHPGCLRHRANLPFAPVGCKRNKAQKNQGVNRWKQQ